MKYGDKIKKARKEKGLSQQVLADKLGVNKGTVSRWEQSKFEPNIETMKQVALILHKPIQYFLSDSFVDEMRNMKGDTAFIPIVSKIAPGSSVLSTENVERYFEIAKKYLPKGEVFVVKVSDDAMAPTIIAGDLVLTYSIKEVKDDDIVAVLMNGSDTIELRRAKKIDETLLLVADNHTASMATIKEGDQVLGKAVQMFRNL